MHGRGEGGYKGAVESGRIGEQGHAWSQVNGHTQTDAMTTHKCARCLCSADTMNKHTSMYTCTDFRFPLKTRLCMCVSTSRERSACMTRRRILSARWSSVPMQLPRTWTWSWTRPSSWNGTRYVSAVFSPHQIVSTLVSLMMTPFSMMMVPCSH